MALYLFGYIIIFLHLIFSLFMIFVPFLTNNVYILITMILLNVVVLTQWYLIGECFLNKIENYFLERKDKITNDLSSKSIFGYYLEMVLGEKNTVYIGSLIPLIVSLYSYFKILSILKPKIPFIFSL